MENIIMIVTVIAILWFWWDSRGVAERAITAAKHKCNSINVAFLNDTVGWKKIRLQRNKQGRMQFQRTYFFEFATDMAQRYQGEVEMLGHQVSAIKLEPYRE